MSAINTSGSALTIKNDKGHMLSLSCLGPNILEYDSTCTLIKDHGPYKDNAVTFLNVLAEFLGKTITERLHEH